MGEINKAKIHSKRGDFSSFHTCEDVQIAKRVVADLIVHGVGAFLERCACFDREPFICERAPYGVRNLADTYHRFL